MGFDAYVAVFFFFFRIGFVVMAVRGLSSQALLRDPLWAWGFDVKVFVERVIDHSEVGLVDFKVLRPVLMLR